MSVIKSYKPIVLFLWATGLFACQKVVSINLNSSAPQYVVEGNVTDTLGQFTVKIAKSVNFDEDNVFPAVSGAVVKITDATTNQIDSLQETPLGSGNYQTSGALLAGVPGHAYNLYINIGGKVLTATSTMPQRISLDSLYFQQSPFGKNLSIVPQYTDPIAKGNCYRFVVTKNDTISNNIIVRNDDLVNGQTISQPIGGGGGGKLMPFEQVVVEMQCIDSMIYQFYFTLGQSRNENSATPTNPVCNIKGGQVLGYFSAHTTSSRTIYVPL